MTDKRIKKAKRVKVRKAKAHRASQERSIVGQMQQIIKRRWN